MDNQDLKAQTIDQKKELPQKESQQSNQQESSEFTETEGKTAVEFLDFDLDDIEVIESKVFA